MNIIECVGLGRRYGRTWALSECTLAIPQGHLVALVGPNGAGQDHAAQPGGGSDPPTAGQVRVLGGTPAGSPAALDGIAFVAQDMPLYRHLSVADMLHLTRNLNLDFDTRLRPASTGRTRHRQQAEGRQALRRPAGPARAHPGAGPASTAARSRRTDLSAGPARAPRLHGHGDDRDGRRRRVGGAVLAHARRTGTRRRLPGADRPRPGPAGGPGGGTARLPPAGHRPGPSDAPGTGPAGKSSNPARRRPDPPARPAPSIRTGHCRRPSRRRPVGVEELALAYLRETADAPPPALTGAAR